MAILLNPSGRSDGPAELDQRGTYEALPALTPAQVSQAASRSVRALEASTSVRIPGVQDTLSREKKHGCTMCHKRFDRPSTLKKHLLVHTGEKAFVCDTCGRRFGVASNLNRHVRRCVLKPVNSPSPNKSISGSPPAGAQSPECCVRSTSTSGYQDPNSGSNVAAASSSSARVTTNDASQTRPTSNEGSSRKAPGQKRRRRAPSPSRWIPASLLSFNLISEEFYKSVPVPLLPVRRNLPKEERDSWDENVGASPYHPTGWKGILPGPGLGLGLGLGGKDVRNLNLGTSTGFMLGRVVFRDQA
ncbi:hypothetical protein BDQ17DRAFT_1301694 [Cyathus striatus]|nr:hypothetical protein BDQ17DRAFT_1301694 [Cyathus striatus]